MKATLFAISLLFVSITALGQEPWELCLDETDFSFNADTSFFKNFKVAKTGCLFRFTESEGKGRKLEVNVCDPNTKISDYAGISDEHPEMQYAGSAGCPAPLFGADIDTPQGTSAGYAQARGKVFEIFQTVKKSFGANAEQVDVTKLKSSTAAGSDAKLACAKLLLEQYLNDCITFTAKPAPADPAKAKKPENLPAGVHPAEIK
ncbi:MAG: hypothetical protein EOP11_00450 [Proteobacteria bacterium]|nr:MAG: hypothetical protein EOP11_00450 [Pseudomonadota bacterium]